LPRRRASFDELEANAPFMLPAIFSNAMSIWDLKVAFLSISPFEPLFRTARNASRCPMPTRSIALHAAVSLKIGAVPRMAPAH